MLYCSPCSPTLNLLALLYRRNSLCSPPPSPYDPLFFYAMWLYFAKRRREMPYIWLYRKWESPESKKHRENKENIVIWVVAVEIAFIGMFYSSIMWWNLISFLYVYFFSSYALLIYFHRIHCLTFFFSCITRCIYTTSLHVYTYTVLVWQIKWVHYPQKVNTTKETSNSLFLEKGEKLDFWHNINCFSLQR